MKPKKQGVKVSDLLAGLAPSRRDALLDSLAGEAAVWIAAQSPLVSTLPKLLRVAPALMPAILTRLVRKREKVRLVGRGARARYALAPPSAKDLEDFLKPIRRRRSRARPEKLKPEDELIYGGD